MTILTRKSRTAAPTGIVALTWYRASAIAARAIPRAGILFHEKGLDDDDSDFLAGALLDHWSAPALNGDVNSGLGRWTEADVADFIAAGKNRFGTAFGTMVEVVNSSTQHITDDDLQAMAVF